ncbi:MAG TPA: hypothetical protein VFX16_32060, partial [Pseudonocardiaceae bacterium]|nr:hypothetical protein [Pseudonocardiaceae bacterium]
MRDIAAELINELKVLRRGRGIENGALEQRVGPTLYFVLGVRPDASAAELRTAVRDWLTELAAQLPADLTLAVHAAFGLREDVRQRFYQDRVAWLAGYLGRDGRT